MHPADERALRAALPPLADGDPLSDLVAVRRLVPGEAWLRAGDAATHVAVVASGLLREFFPLADGTERTKAFITEGALSGSLADLVRRGPSTASIIAEEPTRLLVLPFAVMMKRVAGDPGWDRFAREHLLALLLRKADREYALLALDADARYADFQRDYPGLEARLRARHVASYLGITPEHLSRLRRRRRDAASQVGE